MKTTAVALLVLSASWVSAVEFVPLGIGGWETSGGYSLSGGGFADFVKPVGTTTNDDYEFFPDLPELGFRLPDGVSPAQTPTEWAGGFRDVIVSDDGRVITGGSLLGGRPLWFRFGPNGEMDSLLANRGFAGEEFGSINIDLTADGLRGAAARFSNTSSSDRSFGRNAQNSLPFLQVQNFNTLPAPLDAWVVAGWDGLNAISGDGRVLVGDYANAAYRWTEETERFELLPGMTEAVDVSFDGSVIVGGARRWTEAGGAEFFGAEPTDSFSYSTTAVSADGTVIAGGMIIDGQRQAFRWTEAGGFEGLTDPSGAPFDGVVSAMSADGSTLVGGVLTNTGLQPYFWNASMGVQAVEGYLESVGADLAGYDLRSATGVSADGRVLVGSGRDAQGREAAWLVRIPEPAAVWLLAIACTFAGSRSRATRR